VRGGLERLAAALADRYRVERELGQGGMATVYLAHDIRHDRRVALKVLRPELSAILGPERFLAEIKTTANLQHPHILSLFDSGEADGLVFYVMPFVEGESLRDRLTREKQLPVDEAVRIAREVADALEYAHQKGIIHRDIKPENILLHGGHAMVADFGIALAAVRSTGSTRLTETGLSLGTPRYMAPEQAMGDREITARADIYALGCVLYEMLTAEPPFQGANPQAIIARVMTEEPRSISLQRKTVPPHVAAAVLTALAKLPADRFASAAAFAAALGDVGRAPTGAAAGAVQPARRIRALAVLPWLLLGMTVLAFAVILARAPATPAVLRLGLDLPAYAAWEDQAGATMDLSPDGGMLVYNGRDSSGTRLFLRPLDRLDPTPLAGTVAATHPAFSPDGRWIGFYRSPTYYRVAVSGGTPETVCSSTAAVAGFTWLDARTMAIADGNGLKTCTVSGKEAPLFSLPDSLTFPLWPKALPGGAGLLLAVRSGADFKLGVYDTRARVVRMLGLVGTSPRYVAAGYLVYATLDGVLWAVPFDARRLAVTGEPVVVIPGARVGGGGAAKVAVALTGILVSAEGQGRERVLELADRHGTGERLPIPPGAYFFPRLSPDGSRVALTVGDVSSDIWLFDRRQGTLTRLTFDGNASRPAWTPDGKRIIYSRTSGVSTGLRIVRADGSAPPESLLTVTGTTIFQAVVTPDGRSLVVRTTGADGRDLWRVPLDSVRALRPLLNSPADELSATFSPDGRWMAYVSTESGRSEVYVRSFPDMGGRYQVSIEGGLEPVWSPRGDEIFYRYAGRTLATRVRTTPRFEILGRSLLYAGADISSNGTEAMYDVLPDGQRLLVLRWLRQPGSLTATLNWFENLRAGRVGGEPPVGQ